MQPRRHAALEHLYARGAVRVVIAASLARYLADRECPT
jgi:hypothetical protein